MLEKADFYIERINYQYWNPVTHLLEIELGDGIRADHSSVLVHKFIKNKHYNNIIIKGISVFGYGVAKLINLKGRDLTIYAKKHH